MFLSKMGVATNQKSLGVPSINNGRRIAVTMRATKQKLSFMELKLK